MAVRLLFACALIALFAIDLEHHLLPDKITLPGIATGLILSLIVPRGSSMRSWGRFSGEAHFQGSEKLLPLLGSGGHGGGDVKMLAMAVGVPRMEARARHARAVVGDDR